MTLTPSRLLSEEVEEEIWVDEVLFLGYKQHKTRRDKDEIHHFAGAWGMAYVI